jgi:DNA primase
LSEKKKQKILHDVLGYFHTNGQETLFKCPACEHHKLKLSVNIHKNVFKCWVCDYRGRNVRRLVRRFGTFVQLQRWDQLAGRHDLERFAELFDGGIDMGLEPTLDLPEEFVSLAGSNIPATGLYAHKYLHSRGITKTDILKWKMGYCFSGEYRNRIIIPSFNDKGDVSYFIARSYNGDSYKYKNPKVSKNIVFNELYIDWNEDLILVEGVFDAIIAGNSVPILGSTLRSDSQLIRKIVYNDTPVFVALDPDAREKENRIIETLLKYDVELYKIDVSGYEDVGSMPKEIFRERKQKARFIDRDDYLLMNLLSAV